MSTPFAPGPILNINVTDAPAGAIPLPVHPAGLDVVVWNRGNSDIFLAWGGDAARCDAVGPRTGYGVQARTKETIRLPSCTHIYIITEPGKVSTVQIAMGSGQ